MSLLLPKATSVTPEAAGWRYVGFEAAHLAARERARIETGERELCIVWLSGACHVATERGSWPAVGRRESVFDGLPQAVYAPPSSWVELTAFGDTDLVIGSAPAARGAMPRHIGESDVRTEVRGAGVFERTIHHILMEEQGAERLLVTEVLTPGGHWSSFPPHKHDTDDPPRETALEEIYYFKLRDPRGFALARVYTPDGSLDETVAARDGDLVLVPRGYHTVAAAPGYDCYYLNVMAGATREWRITFDPDHDHMKW